MIALLLTVLALPVLALLVDCSAQLRAIRRSKTKHHAGPARARRRRGPRPVVGLRGSTRPCDDYTLVVPIYGNISYLENEEWLSRYGAKVLLATSGAETPAFYEALFAIADRHGFRVHVSTTASTAARRGGAASRRATGGTIRDTIVRDAHAVLTSRFVVCIDADTVTETSVDLLVGAFEESGLDLGSVPLSVANTGSVLGRLQRIEYVMAMRLRRIMPWMVCGGCHLARREVHADLMARHSLFFQGNDVELGLLAVSLGYQVGHVDFTVPTTVPDTVRGWWRQRLAWAGGEFRVMLVNIRLARHHPYLYIYGALISFALAPLRWWSLAHSGLLVAFVVLAYALVVALVTRDLREPLLLVYPLYALVYALVLLPFGVVTYAHMAIAGRNAGIIRGGRRAAATTLAVRSAHPVSAMSLQAATEDLREPVRV